MKTSVLRIVLGPLVVSAAVTALRLAGELLHWSERWFSTDTGGIMPSGWTWLVGITWLPVLFGPYFARTLGRAGETAPSGLRVLALGVVGMALTLVGLRFVAPRVQLPFPWVLLPIWAAMLAGAALQLLGWLALFRTLVVYGLGSRLVVTLVMLFAMLGNWGTHYDYVGMPPQFQMPLVPRFLWLAFIPQMVFWVAFTVVLGAVSAGIYMALTQTWRKGLA